MRKNATKSALYIAVVVTGVTGCASPEKGTAIGAGAGAGAAVGAGIGALTGGGKGVLIGAAAGGAAGGMFGNLLDRQAAELRKVAETKRTDEGIIVSLKNDLLFDTGSANLTGDAKNQVTQLGAIIAKYPSDQVTIIGHTDDVGGVKRNLELSKERANSVQAALVQSGVPAGRTKTEGLGESEPAVPGKTKAARAKNRRVELKIIDPTAKG